MPKDEKREPLQLRYTISHPAILDKLGNLAIANFTTVNKMFYDLALDKMKEVQSDTIIKKAKP